jgi:hypothetical protein
MFAVALSFIPAFLVWSAFGIAAGLAALVATGIGMYALYGAGWLD